MTVNPEHVAEATAARVPRPEDGAGRAVVTWAYLPDWGPYQHAYHGLPEGPGTAQLSLCGTVEWLFDDVAVFSWFASRCPECEREEAAA